MEGVFVMILGYILNESSIPGFSETNIIREDKEGRLIAEATLQTADVVNRNRRIYPKEELFREITCDRTKELLEAGYFRGEMGHPLSTELIRQQTIDDTRTCVQFLKLWTEGNDVKAWYRGTNNAFGHAINEDLKDNCKPAFSLRALGNIVKTPRGSEVRNLRIITYDCVIYPSHPNAYTQRVVKGQLNESALVDFLDDSKMEASKSHLQTVAEAANINYYNDVLDLGNKEVMIPFKQEEAIDCIKNESANFKYLAGLYDFAYDNISLNEAANSVTIKTKGGDTLIVNLEKHVQSEIMNYCALQDDLRNL